MKSLIIASMIAFAPHENSYARFTPRGQTPTTISWGANNRTVAVRLPDTGTHYRSAIVPLSEEQRLVASAYLAQMRASGLWRRPIVVRIERHRRFFPAEAYHQDFMARNPRHPYIVAWDVAKVNALRRMFPTRYKRDVTAN